MPNNINNNNKIVIVAFLLTGAASAAPLYSLRDAFNVYPVSTCPYNNSLLGQYTDNHLQTTAFGQAAWASVAGQLTACPAPLTPSAQRVTVASFSNAQHNLDQWYPEVPRSKVYTLAALRSTSVVSAYIDIDIVDAEGSVIVPRLKLTLGEPSGRPEPPVQPLLPTRRAVNRGKRALPKGKRQQRKPHMGRRKGKGGFMGGIGGNGRYGGGSGGFRGAGSTKSYGYSSKALSSRYVSGYKRTPYGYTGRSVALPLLLFSGHRHGLHHRSRCDQYTGNSRLRCQKSYNNETDFGDGVSTYTPSTPVNRDDIMAATVNSTAMFPLTVRVHRAALVFNAASQSEPWEQALMFSFSEVDWDDEEDLIMSFPVLCILVGIALLATTCICICCCNCLEWECWARLCPCCPSCCCRKCRGDVHTNVVCDMCEMDPIIGNRYNKLGENYDLCQACFDQHIGAQHIDDQHEARSKFACICKPGQSPINMAGSQSDNNTDKVIELQELGPPVAEYKTPPSTPTRAPGAHVVCVQAWPCPQAAP